jgi:hypothetical protein
MKERPILFSAPMVRETFAQWPTCELTRGGMFGMTAYRAGKPVLVPPPGGHVPLEQWPREWRDDTKPESVHWRPSIHMPRMASRITLEVTGVRVERLQAISEADALAEGAQAHPWGPWWQGYKNMLGDLVHQEVQGEEPPDWMVEPKRMAPRPHLDKTARDDFRAIWSAINGLDNWNANPWVWVVEFRKVEA